MASIYLAIGSPHIWLKVLFCWSCMLQSVVTLVFFNSSWELRRNITLYQCYQIVWSMNLYQKAFIWGTAGRFFGFLAIFAVLCCTLVFKNSGTEIEPEQLFTASMPGRSKQWTLYHNSRRAERPLRLTPGIPPLLFLYILSSSILNVLNTKNQLLLSQVPKMAEDRIAWKNIS